MLKVGHRERIPWRLVRLAVGMPTHPSPSDTVGIFTCRPGGYTGSLCSLGRHDTLYYHKVALYNMYDVCNLNYVERYVGGSWGGVEI